MRGVRRNAVWIRSSVIYGVEILQHRKLHSGCQKAVINPPAATLGPGPWWVALPSLCTPAFSCCLSAFLLCTSHYSRMRPGICLRGAQLDWERAERWPKRAIEAMNKMPQGEERRSLSSSSRPCPWSLVTIQCVGAPLRPWPHSSLFRLLPSAPLSPTLRYSCPRQQPGVTCVTSVYTQLHAIWSSLKPLPFTWVTVWCRLLHVGPVTLL